MAKSKINIERGFRPAYVDRDTLSYMLCVSPTTIDNMRRLRRLPEPIDMWGMPRWKWSDIEDHLDALTKKGVEDPYAKAVLDAQVEQNQGVNPAALRSA